MTHVVTPSKVQHEQPEEPDKRDQLSDLDTCTAQMVKVSGMMDFTAVVGGASEDDRELISNIIQQEQQLITKTLDIFTSTSEASTANNLPVGDTLSVSDLFRDSFLKAEQIESSTDGLFSIQFKNPGAYIITEEGKLSKVKEGKLDFCGIAKGITVDNVMNKLREKFVNSSGIMVSWEGDVSVTGRHPSGGPWLVSVAEQDSSTPIIATLELVDGDSVATSGVQSHNSGHIFSPKTGEFLDQKSTDLKVVSIATPGGCALADALATAAFATACQEQAEKFCVKNSHPSRSTSRISQYVLASGETGSLQLVRSSQIGCEEPMLNNQRMNLHHKGGTVVVIGGGLAGLSAAIEAAKAGCLVTVLEKMEKVGGNSAKATSGINAWGTMRQANSGIADNEALFERDTHLSGKGGTTHPSLVRLLSTKSSAGVHWLTHEIGVPLTVICQLGGASRPRAHRAPPKADGSPTPIGFTIIQSIKDYIQKKYSNEITFITSANVTSLITSPSKDEVTGVRYTKGETDCTIENAQAVILTTGGYGFQCETLKKYRPDLGDVPTTNGPWAQGDVFNITKDLGVKLIDMDKVQVHPTGLVDPKNTSSMTKILGPEALRGSGGILINGSGRRFVNELDLRSVVTAAINENGGTAFCVLNKPMQEAFGKPMLSFYADKMRLFTKCDNITTLAEHIGCEEGVLRSTLDSYRDSYKAGRCSATNKNTFPESICSDDVDFIVAKVQPSVHYTMGGLSITASCEVQKTLDGVVGGHVGIKRLFAAGECTGGVHGANRLGGNSLLECVVMGRTAGERAATIQQKQQFGLTTDTWTPVTFREHRPHTSNKYGKNSALLRFNLPGALQPTGICLGEYVAIKAKFRGKNNIISGYYSPVTRPTDLGCIDLLLRTDEKGGMNAKFFTDLRPGDGLLMKSMGGLRLRKTSDKNWTCENTGLQEVQNLNLIAGGTGIAPMMQITRGVSKDQGSLKGIKLLYAAETEADLGLAVYIERLTERCPEFFSSYFVLNHPPLGWTQGVNFIDLETTRSKLYPASSQTLTVICGPPIFEKIVKKYLTDLGHDGNSIYCYSDC